MPNKKTSTPEASAIKKTTKTDSGVFFEIDTTLYPTDVIYQTAYIFTDKAYIRMSGDPEKIITVELKWKDIKNNIFDIEGEFLNELLNQSVRKMIDIQNGKTKELIISRALVSASGNTQADEILEELDESEEIDIEKELEIIDQGLKDNV